MKAPADVEERAAESVKALEERLAEMAKAATDAQGFLSGLARAMFPGEPSLGQLTWPDARRDGVDHSVPESPEARLRAAETRFRTLVEQIPAVTFSAVLGEGKNEIYVSPHIEAMLGFSQQEWLEAPFLWFWQLHPDDRELWNREFTRGLQTGGPFRAECRFFARDGHVVWVHGEARLVKDERGRPLLLQGVAFDITESKRAQEVLLRQARADEELAIARRVQTSILPRTPSIEGLEIAAAMRPADEVGGDYYDALPAPDGAWLAIGDVSGHGLSSGLVMMMVQSAMGALVRAQPQATPRDILIALNGLLHDNIRARLENDDHVTLCLLRFRRDGLVTFAGAHEDLLVCRRATGKVERIATPGTWLGAARDIAGSLVNSRFQLEVGDVLLLYTDGMLEGVNAQGEFFEIDRLSDALEGVCSASAQRIRDELLQASVAWTAKQEDDMSLMVLRYTGDGAAVAAGATAAGAQARPELTAFSAPGYSLFEQVGPPERVDALSVRPGGPIRLGAEGRRSGFAIGLRLWGAAESPDQRELARVLSKLHEEALGAGAPVVEVDLRDLKFMTSSCIKAFITWLGQVRAEPSERRYRIRFVSSPAMRWQRASLASLVAFAPEQIIREPLSHDPR